VIRVYHSGDPKHPKTYTCGHVAEAESAVPGWRVDVDGLFNAPSSVCGTVRPQPPVISELLGPGRGDEGRKGVGHSGKHAVKVHHTP
jgi:hypothetical protein